MSLAELRTKRCISEGLMAQESLLLPPPAQPITVTPASILPTHALRIEAELAKIMEELDGYQTDRLSSLEEEIAKALRT